MNTRQPLRYLTAVAVSLLTIATSQAATIFQHDFTGGAATNLNTQTVDTGSGNWVAASNYKADGSFATGGGSSATLAFTPNVGTVYTLDARITNTGTSWIALGFADGQSTNTGAGARFVNGATPLGRAWTLLEDDGSGQAHGTGSNDGSNWTSSFTAPTVDLRIELDTTGGAGNYTATWLAKDTGDTSYTVVRTVSSVDDSITSVGFAESSGGAGSLVNFKLTVIPEPSSFALVGLAGLLLASCRRRRA